MGNSWPPAGNAAPLRTYRKTLTSGSGFTVPVGVFAMNVMCKGGGGCGGAAGLSYANGSPPGGVTTFSGPAGDIDAVGGYGAVDIHYALGTAPAPAHRDGVPGVPGTGQGGGGSAYAIVDSASGISITLFAENGRDGAEVWDWFTCNPGDFFTYSIGAGGGPTASDTNNGAAGGSGFIIVEWQA